MQNILNLLGLARKAGKLALGYTATTLAIKKGLVPLVLMASDTAPNTREKMERLCHKYRVDIYYLVDHGELGRALGKSTQNVVGVMSKELASAFKKQILSARME